MDDSSFFFLNGTSQAKSKCLVFAFERSGPTARRETSTAVSVTRYFSEITQSGRSVTRRLHRTQIYVDRVATMASGCLPLPSSSTPAFCSDDTQSLTTLGSTPSVLSANLTVLSHSLASSSE